MSAVLGRPLSDARRSGTDWLGVVSRGYLPLLVSEGLAVSIATCLLGWSEVTLIDGIDNNYCIKYN
tara:strand:- start:451 stop:648 length:198 start_codon:yes stop_codon:yes gene_type:complete